MSSSSSGTSSSWDTTGGMTVDEEFDADTASAVESWQDAIGVPETGAVEPGDAGVPAGPRRVGQLAVTVGSRYSRGWRC